MITVQYNLEETPELIPGARYVSKSGLGVDVITENRIREETNEKNITFITALYYLDLEVRSMIPGAIPPDSHVVVYTSDKNEQWVWDNTVGGLVWKGVIEELIDPRIHVTSIEEAEE